MIIQTVGEQGSSDPIRDGIRILNSEKSNELPYHLDENEGRPPKALIVIGGDLLSRGVTIEGLCVSYYLRLARIPSADTELQRCRWFGPKWDFRDLVTLHIQEQHQTHFKDIGDHNEDLVRQFKETILRGENARTSIFLLKMRDSFQATGFSKRGRTINLEDSFSGNWSQFKQPSVKHAAHNRDNLQEYISTLKKPVNRIYVRRGKLWEGVDPKSLISLLKSLKIDVRRPSMIRPKDLANYLEKWIKQKGGLPPINVVQRWGRGDSPISQKMRDMDGADGSFFVRSSFVNLAAGASGNFSGDWFIDAIDQREGASDMDREKYNSWFKENSNTNEKRWQRTRLRRRVEGLQF